jgi:type I restriction enzyme S subunit
VPSKALTIHFWATIGDLMFAIFSADAMNRRISKIRDVLLPKLISGEIRVPDAEHLVENSEA